ncbi:MAG: hypothetical protein A2V81_04490 [Candidatus Abawacabacteria bacterium RBG_16_42_10]|uniref:AAA+ ATPase domain-containing protein n=1 Tax=Candidatus Abawacabacteria bacterium RBG_16_42_10 TaxID=1817814 RepID=A0A1F4XJG4_9BACT|nr:MAG: hypothetical protein A2V81_04490 [Candidatus Abawacabacteria bacterium RBG_16_42_10]
MLPLAHRIRPQTLDHFFGQEHLLGKEGILRKLLGAEVLHSFLLHGPSGTGKTTIASIIAHNFDAYFIELNATDAKVSVLKKKIVEAKEKYEAYNKKTIIFIDEIHRFNKAQQDALLPAVEAGDIVLIGATTENPSYEVNQALLSRVTVYKLDPLSQDSLRQILDRALKVGFEDKYALSEEVKDHLIQIAAGDARTLLNSLELLISSKQISSDLNTIRTFLEKQYMRYDKKSSEHYNTISAFIKSVRGSDVDASLIWLWKMVESGEDPKFIFRRMMILASEDIGMADSYALIFVTTAMQAFEAVGYPEGKYFLAHACIYIAKAPKSNNIAQAIGNVSTYIKENPILQVPLHLTKEGGKNYLYPHNYPGNWVKQDYFPVDAARKKLYPEQSLR